MVADPCDAIRTRIKQVRESWTAVPLREGTQKADWREQALADIELMEAAVEVIDELRAALREAHRTALDVSEERVSNSYKSETTNGL